MENMVNIKINDKEYSVPANSTVLEAARYAGEEAALQSAQIFTKHNMRRVLKILYPNLKLHSKKQMKRVIGLNFYIGQSISMSKLSNYYPQNAPL